MNLKIATLLIALTIAAAGCTAVVPTPSTPTPPSALATAQAVVAASRNAVPTTPTPRPVPPKHGLSRDDPAPSTEGIALEEGYVIFAKIQDNDATEHVRSLNPANPGPGAGNRYVSVTAIMSSAQQASKALMINSNEFGLIGSSGAKYKPLTSLGAKGPDGEMDGGRQLFGELIFEVPKEEKPHVLTYSPQGKPDKEYFLSLDAS